MIRLWHFYWLLAVAAFAVVAIGHTAGGATPEANPKPASAPADAKAAPAPAAAKPVDFNRDVVPILSNNCFKCHGPDCVGAQGRACGWMSPTIATKPAESGAIAIVPGKPDKSELVQRIFSDDDDERMPPPKSNKHLTDAQRQTLKQWIARRGRLQAALGLRRAAAASRARCWPATARQNPIDDFVLAKLHEQKLQPSPEADRVTLVRRLYFDLIGLPPSPEQVAEFVNDHDPHAYEKLVDRLLASRALWRADGHVLARSGPLCRQRRLPQRQRRATSSSIAIM